MPANLPPQYFEAEKRYREARTPEEKVAALEEMLVIMPKHKGTDRLRGELRRKISKFKARSQQKKRGARREAAYAIEPEGAAQVVLVGPPNTGKSAMVAGLTHARPEVAPFPHTTWKPTPGMVAYENIRFQLIDTPPLSSEYVEPALADLIRRAHLCVLVLDLHADPFGRLEESLAVLEGLRIYPEGIPLPVGLTRPPCIKRVFIALNKVDGEAEEEDYKIFAELCQFPLECVAVSAQTGRGLEEFLETLFRQARIVRVYTRAPGKAPDKGHPFVLPAGSTLEALAGKIHKDFVRKLRYARIWGERVFDGQKVQRDYVLEDGDVVEIHV